jgi:nitrate/TMAO reductase-like tetraheme cytochrome c subunit
MKKTEFKVLNKYEQLINYLKEKKAVNYQKSQHMPGAAEKEYLAAAQAYEDAYNALLEVYHEDDVD